MYSGSSSSYMGLTTTKGMQWLQKRRIDCPSVLTERLFHLDNPPVVVTGAHFLKGDTECIIAYLHHGIWSAYPVLFIDDIPAELSFPRRCVIETEECVWDWGPDEKTYVPIFSVPLPL